MEIFEGKEVTEPYKKKTIETVENIGNTENQ